MMDDSSAGFPIGEVSQAIGLTPQTLRLWEREHLVSPGRTIRGYRVYSKSDVERLRKVRHLRKVEGLNFAAIRKQLGPVLGPSEEAAHDAVPQDDPGSDPRKGGTPGNCLRRLRRRAHKTLKEISQTTGLSISFISALERGSSGASVASLRLLAEAYGVNMRQIFGADLEHDSPLVRSGERPAMQWENGVRFEEMAAGEKAMDPAYIRIPPHAGSEGSYSHEGEEFVYVISGNMHVELKDQEPYLLGPGDTLYFPSATLHRWWTEDVAAEAIYVNTPPTF